jgi:hypothetical protein
MLETYIIKQRGVEYMKKIIAIVVTLSMVLSVPVFADTNSPVETTQTTQTTETTETTEATEATTVTAEATTTTTTVNTEAEAGITPDSILYSLDKLMEEIQLALVTDAVKEAELLAKIAQERLAESNEMADEEEVELTQKALEEYKDNLEEAVKLIETAMEDGKAVAAAMDAIQDANLKDAAAIEKILASIPEEFRDEVKAEIEDLAAATEATAETAQVVEGTEEEQNSVKQEITNKIIEEKIQDATLIAKINEAGLNTRQVIAIMSLAEQADKPLAEVIDLFLQNEKGIGSTAKELGLTTKDALKGINGSFKDTKETIKNAFKAAIQLVEEDEQEEVAEIVESTLAGQVETAATAAKVKETKEKLVSIVKEAKAQVEAITADKDAEKALDKIEKAVEKADKEIEKAIEKADKEIEKAVEKADKEDKSADDKDDDKEVEDDSDDEEAKDKEVKENKGKSNKKN